MHTGVGAMTLGELLDQTELGLTLLTAHETGPARPVRGAHCTELDGPTRWVPRDWILLTNGLRVRGRAEDQRRLVAELHDGERAALGWAVGAVLHRVPRAVLAEAEEREFPVFLVPFETAFREIISVAGTSRLNSDLMAMRRRAAMEDYLMDALRLGEPERNILQRLASMLEADVALFDSSGDVIGVVGSSRLPELQTAARESAVDREDDGLTVVPVDRGPGRTPQVLVVASRHQADEQRMLRPVARRAGQMLGLIATSELRRDEADRARGAELLRRALADVDEATARVLDGEARTLGIDWSSPVQVIAGERRADRDAASPEASAIAHALGVTGLPHLVAHDERPVALVQGDGPALAAALNRDGVAASGRVGVGRSITSLREVGASLDDALVALLQTRSDGRGDLPVVWFEDLDPVAWLVATSKDAGDRCRLRGFLDPLRRQQHLIETLRTWLETDCNMAETAALLHLHRNSLRHRLDRIELLLGASLRSPRTLANLQVALIADALGEGRRAA
jgi:purine catabolism regulator